MVYFPTPSYGLPLFRRRRNSRLQRQAERHVVGLSRQRRLAIAKPNETRDVNTRPGRSLARSPDSATILAPASERAELQVE